MNSTATISQRSPLKLSVPVILIRALCIFSAVELIYQLSDLLTNSYGTIYLIYKWYYTYSFISTILSVPLMIYVWRLKNWAAIILMVLGAINQMMWYSFGVWDYRMLIFPVLFLLIWIWHLSGRGGLSKQ